MHTSLFRILIVLFISADLFGQARTSAIGTEASAQRNIFVSPSGDDRNTGLTMTDPLKTIAAGLAAVLPGDTVYVLPGTYAEPIKFVNRKGLPEKPVYLYGYTFPSRLMPVIDGGAIKASLETSKYWAIIQNSEWIEIGNLSFTNGWADPVNIYNSSYISFKNCVFSGARRVIYARGALTHHLLVEDNRWDQGGEYLWKLVKDEKGVDAWTSMHHGDLVYYNGSLIDIRGTSGSIVIRNNTITNAFNGIRFTAQEFYDTNVEISENSVSNIRDNDFEPEHYTYNLYIHHNSSHNIHKTMSVDNVAGGYIYYFGNRVTSDTTALANTNSTGLWKVYGDDENLSYPMYAFNNSFYGNHRAFSSMGGKAIGFRHYNNAYFFSGSRTWELTEWDTTYEFDYDLSNKPWPPTITNHFREPHGKIAKVDYRDPAHGDLKLRNNSPAIDAGKIISLPELGWTQAYKGKAPDIGAYEGDQPIDGPAFRFRTPPGITLPYKEKPRIVKYKTDNNKLILYFSDELDSLTLNAASILLKETDHLVPVSSIALPNRFELVIVTSNKLDANKLSIDFSTFPKGINGEAITFWASAIRHDLSFRSK